MPLTNKGATYARTPCVHTNPQVAADLLLQDSLAPKTFAQYMDRAAIFQGFMKSKIASSAAGYESETYLGSPAAFAHFVCHLHAAGYTAKTTSKGYRCAILFFQRKNGTRTWAEEWATTRCILGFHHMGRSKGEEAARPPIRGQVTGTMHLDMMHIARQKIPTPGACS